MTIGFRWRRHEKIRVLLRFFLQRRSGLKMYNLSPDRATRNGQGKTDWDVLPGMYADVARTWSVSLVN